MRVNFVCVILPSVLLCTAVNAFMAPRTPCRHTAGTAINLNSASSFIAMESSTNALFKAQTMSHLKTIRARPTTIMGLFPIKSVASRILAASNQFQYGCTSRFTALDEFLKSKLKNSRKLFVTVFAILVCMVSITSFSDQAMAERWVPGQTIPDLRKGIHGDVPMQQWELRDTLHGYIRDPTVNKKVHRIPEDKQVLTKSTLFNSDFSMTTGEQIAMENKYWIVRTASGERAEKTLGFLKSIGSVLGIGSIFLSIVFTMRKVMSLAEDEEQQLYGEKLEVDATELEPESDEADLDAEENSENAEAGIEPEADQTEAQQSNDGSGGRLDEDLEDDLL